MGRLFLSLQYINIKLLISCLPHNIFFIGMIQIPSGRSLKLPIPLYQQKKQIQLELFPLNFPMQFNLLFNYKQFNIIPLRVPVNIMTCMFAYIGITINFVSQYTVMMYKGLKIGELSKLYTIYNKSLLNPQQTNTIIGLTSFDTSDLSSNYIDFQKMNYFDLYDHTLTDRIVWVDIQLSGNPNYIAFTVFMLGNKICQNNQFTAYRTQLFYGSPDFCGTCHLKCKTCVVNQYQTSFSGQDKCKTCSIYKYLQILNPRVFTGQCLCFPGLLQDPITKQCLPCQSRCLSFNLYFMLSSTNAEFVIVFTDLINNLIPIQKNLKVYININGNDKNTPYEIKQKRQSVYLVYLSEETLEQCETKCLIKFIFIKPQKIFKRNKFEALYQYQRQIQLSDYYIVAKRLPETLNQASLITNLIVAAAMSGGASSLLKILFQLQQSIQYHKYLNLQIPLIFKQFIQSISSFRFLDVTILFPQQFLQYLFSLSPSSNDLDYKGNIKSIYYDYGCGYYKNIIPVIISILIIFGINILLFTTLRFIPIKICWLFSQKLRIRRLITITDLIQTIILPVIVYMNFQIEQIKYDNKYFIMYTIMILLNGFVMMYPFIVGVIVYKNRKNQLMVEIYQDLMQDCVINNKITYIFFIYTYYRKIIFSLFLNSYFSGSLQLIIFIIINIIYLSLLIYIIIYKLFISKIKMLTRLINILIIITIQIIILFYHNQKYQLNKMLDIGITCMYLAIVATVISVVEVGIKLGDLIWQKIKAKYGVKVNGEAKEIQKINNKNNNNNNHEYGIKKKKNMKQNNHIKLNNLSKQKLFTHNNNKSNNNIPKQQQHHLPDFLREDSITTHNIYPATSNDSLKQKTISNNTNSNRQTKLKNKQSVGFFNKFFNKSNKNSQVLQVKYKKDQSSFQAFTDIISIDIDQIVDFEKIHPISKNVQNKMIKNNSQFYQNNKMDKLNIRKTNSVQITINQHQNNYISSNNIIKNNQNKKNNKNIDEQIRKAQQRIRQKISQKQGKNKQVQSINNLAQSSSLKKNKSKTVDQTQRIKNVQLNKEQYNEEINEKKTRRRKIDKSRTNK